MPTDPLLLAVPLPVLAAGQRLLEVAHVAHRLGFSHEQVRRLIRTGQLKAIRFGKRWRVDPLDLQAFIDAQRWTGPDRRVAAGRSAAVA